MPELPEVQTTLVSLNPLLNQRLIDLVVYQPKLRWQVPEDVQQLKQQTLLTVKRRAKYLILVFSQHKLIIHLGMSGSLQQYPLGTPKRKHDHIIFTFTNQQLHYHDPRRFGAVLWHHEYATKLLDKLGVEPLADEFNICYLTEKITQSNRPIKSLMMDQHIVVGVGNIYATESLFYAGIHPNCLGKHVTKQQCEKLVRQIKLILVQAINQGGSTLKDYTVADGKTGYFQQTLAVYGRAGEPCLHCQTKIETLKINQRTSNFCPKCQPLV